MLLLFVFVCMDVCVFVGVFCVGLLAGCSLFDCCFVLALFIVI